MGWVNKRMHNAMERERLLCHYCNKRSGTTIDHIVPEAMGGPSSMWNMQPSCPTCNHEKASAWPTCTCEKCQLAVALFMQNPTWSNKAVKFLESRRDRLVHSRELLVSIKLAKLDEGIEGAQAQIDAMHELAKEHNIYDTTV